MKITRRAFTLRCAFTLMELLVTLAIFALLAALLFPVLASVRERGRTAACASNLHQLYGAFALYAEDHDRYLPPYDVRVSGADWADMQPHPVRDEAAQLVTCLRPYTHSTDIWFCPSDPFAHTVSTVGDIRHQFLSYDYAAPFLPYYETTPRTLDATIYRTHTPLLVLEPSDLTLLTDSSRPPLYRVAFYSHNGLFNTVYMDGHLKASAQQ